MGTLGRAFYSVGFWIRETGQALDRLGCRLQGKNCFREQLSRHRTLMNVFDKAPIVDKEAFVAPSASVIGNVQIGRGSSIWYGCVLRGDVNTVSVGSGTNIQDNSLVHVAKSNLSGKSHLRHAGLVCWTRHFFALAPAMPLGLPATLLGPGGLPGFLLTMGGALGRSDAISMGSRPNLCLTEGGGPNLCLTRTRSLGYAFSSVGGFSC
ncbi:hypothetical protein F2Q68_00040904 [Brassica cretica]|uniref:Uncharacterized protein n=1 Tax=Brassica cretica TaxID=69181 RepID=A0A8S9MT78_BRACR|nr:hypothetical protein F2Q68_00040904 [Brassica cretica]